MSNFSDCDEGFVTSVACNQSNHSFQNIKKDNYVQEIKTNDKIKCNQCLRLLSQNSDLMNENINLKELNKELYDLDQKRQNYDIERQDYILRLLKTIKKLQLRSSRMISSDCQSTNHKKVVDTNSGETGSDYKLRGETSLLEQSYQNALRENVSLNKELEEIRSNFDNLVEQLSKIESEHIQVLQMQANIHKEDFECERRDKQMSEKQLKKVTKEMQRLDTICLNYEKKFQLLMKLCKIKDPLNNNNNNNSGQSKNGITDESIKSNSLPNKWKHKTSDNSESDFKSQSNIEIFSSDEILECPNCRLIFPIQFHEHLLQHFEKCQQNI
ncbi:probable E3 ubiquitin-protein ligase bre1 [Oppia nitens]|uniref:probable E3 ubiquitin-protein ligase bre1 n=1 Tax=Oppia nitens TaxID=1686743 RepID=UPI0023DCEAEF|nr:probable E3 ubiquitin-protein ligase bre1 [Oppia nitens]